MKRQKAIIFGALCGAFLVATAARAGEAVHEHKMQIVFKEDGGDRVDADVSDLQVGESRSFVTDSGKTVDILRSADGLELYIDGELKDLGFGGENLHGDHHVLHEEITIECEAEQAGACERDFVFIQADGAYDYEMDTDHVLVHEVIRIEKEDDAQD